MGGKLKEYKKRAENEMKPNESSYILKNCSLKLFLVVVKELPSNNNYSIQSCWLFFSSFSKWWEERLDLAMI